MSAFQERAPRLDFSFPLEFRSEGERFSGRCLNVSESGLLAIFDQLLDLWARGELSLNYGTGTCVVPARVARVGEREVGFAFAVQTLAQREAVRAMLEVAERETHLAGRPPF